MIIVEIDGEFEPSTQIAAGASRGSTIRTKASRDKTSLGKLAYVRLSKLLNRPLGG